MADYSFGTLSFVYGTGSTIAMDYVGRPQGYRTSIARLPLTLTKSCKVSSISFKGATVNRGTITYLCRINKSSTDSTASGSVGTITFGTNTASVSFNATLEAGTYYVWFYFSGSNYGYVGSNSIPFAFSSAVITTVDTFPTLHANQKGTVKKVKGGFVNQAGTIKAIKAIFVNKNGTIKKLK